jgi:hypothetical protein
MKATCALPLVIMRGHLRLPLHRAVLWSCLITSVLRDNTVSG